MPKRKRSNHEDGDHVKAMRKDGVSEKLLQSKKQLHRALKTAKGFERQKLGKRLKRATEAGSSDEIVRINREIEALKNLDLDKMTEAQLYRSLLKNKAMSESELLPEVVRRGLPKPEGTDEEIKALHNVTSGMWNMKPVKEAMENVMRGMFAGMGIPTPVAKGKAKKEPVKAISRADPVGIPRRSDDEVDVSDVVEEMGKTESGKVPGEALKGGESEGLDRKRRAIESDEQEDDEDELDEDALSRYDTLIGGSSSEESFDKSKYNSKRTTQPSTRLSLSLSPSPSRSPSPSLSGAPSQFPSPPPTKAPKSTRAKTKNPPPPPSKKVGGSTFLPSLIGGYWSGSESSASDIEDNDALGSAAPVRKNRPGQTARRAIWEKKFGQRANHIKSGQGPVAERRGMGRDEGWDARRGARESGDRGGKGRRGGPGGQRDFRRQVTGTGENAVGVERRRRGMGRKDDAGPLHPSWEAAKKAKEAKTTATFQGKKVTFD